MNPTDTPTPTPTPTGTPVPMEVALTGQQWDLILIAIIAVVFLVGFLAVVKL